MAMDVDLERALLELALEYTPKLRKLGVARVEILGGRLTIDVGPDMTEPPPPAEVKRPVTTPPGRGRPLERPQAYGSKSTGVPTFKRDPDPDEDPTPEGE